MMGERKGKSLERFLLEMKAELVIRRKKIDVFKQGIAMDNTIHAITETIKELGKRGVTNADTNTEKSSAVLPEPGS